MKTKGLEEALSSEERILQKRARKLAEPLRLDLDADQGFHERNFLSFYIGDICFAMENKYIDFIQQYQDITPCPSMPSCMLGVSYWQGLLYLVIDSYSLLEINEEETTASLLFISSKKLGQIALKFHKIGIYFTLSDSKIQKEGYKLPLPQEKYCTGLIYEKNIPILDGSKILLNKQLGL